MVLVQKWALFQVFFIGNKGQENVFYDILERKNAFLGYKTRSHKSRKIDIFPKGLPMVLVQKWPFFRVFFLGNIGQEKVFYDIVERKNAFLGYKNKKFKKSKNWHFSPMVFVQKWPFFELCFLGNVGQENVFYDILQRENAFLRYKNMKFKKSKNWHFLKGVNKWFGPKMGIFQTFFFRQYSLGKCLLWYCRTKKRLSRL